METALLYASFDPDTEQAVVILLTLCFILFIWWLLAFVIEQGTTQAEIDAEIDRMIMECEAVDHIFNGFRGHTGGPTG